MIVTRIEAITNKRVRIFIDDEFAFVLYKGELRLYGIKEGQELDDAVYTEIRTGILPKRAKLRCMNLLKARAYTEKQLRDKLRQNEYAGEIIEEAIDYVKAYGYVDDRKYAEDFVFCHANDKSRKRMEQDLLTKGIERKIIQEVLEQASEEGNGPDELAMAVKYLKKKKYDPDTASPQEKQRLFAFLYRKGFNTEIIRSVLLLDITSI